tara:strand:+ start:498 stop:632 length:135 start_codon:yes stop_codon:yes gene_type:complete
MRRVEVEEERDNRRKRKRKRKRKGRKESLVSVSRSCPEKVNTAD